MTPADFRRLALELPGAIESDHMGHPDFRVGGKIFATLGYPDAKHGVVLLAEGDRPGLSTAFTPVTGGWGKRGATQVHLPAVDAAALEEALLRAWRRRAPKRLLKKLLEDSPLS